MAELSIIWERRAALSEESKMAQAWCAAGASSSAQCGGQPLYRATTTKHNTPSSSRVHTIVGNNRNQQQQRRVSSGRGRGALQVRGAGAFTQLIEIPAARGLAKGLMVPARMFMDGASSKEEVLASIAVRVEGQDECIPVEVAPLLPLSGYDVGEVPFVMAGLTS